MTADARALAQDPGGVSAPAPVAHGEFAAPTEHGTDPDVPPCFDYLVPRLEAAGWDASYVDLRTFDLFPPAERVRMLAAVELRYVHDHIATPGERAYIEEHALPWRDVVQQHGPRRDTSVSVRGQGGLIMGAN